MNTISFLLKIAVIQSNFRVELFPEYSAKCPKIHKSTFISHVMTGIVKGILSAACTEDREAETGQISNPANMSSLFLDLSIGMKPEGYSAKYFLVFIKKNK